MRQTLIVGPGKITRANKRLNAHAAGKASFRGRRLERTNIEEASSACMACIDMGPMQGRSKPALA